jgi:adenosylmethionine-8-amino-7-oxononanoate aminotransferase
VTETPPRAGLAQLDQRLLWHPFTPMGAWLEAPPLVIDRADGNELIDVEGRRYLDGVSSLWVNVHGHRHPHIDAAVRAQLDKVAHSTLLGLASTPSIRLAEKLLAAAPPGLARVFFSDSGSTAVEVALKMAFQAQRLRGHTGRHTFLALENAYHGDTLGSVSVGGIDTFHRIFHSLLFHTVRAPTTLEGFRRVFTQHARQLAAVVMEPLVQGAAGIRLSPPGLLAAAAELCRQHGVLLIADEVATGFGRTGSMFACSQESVTPDFLCVAKGLTGGYLPVAATLTTASVFETFLGAPNERLTFFHGHSFGGNPLGCAAALASLEVFEQEDTLAHLPAKVERLATRLAEAIAPLPHVFEVRQRGLMVGIELRHQRRTPYPESVAIGAQACAHARTLGVILRPLGAVVVLMPPLSITDAQIDRLVEAARAGIEHATGAVIPDAARAAARTTPATPGALTGVFFAGTDTGAGKTTVARALLRLVHRQRGRLVPFKPVETGCNPTPADARALLAASALDLAIEDVCPFPFPDPVAPSIAAALAGRALDLGQLVAHARRLAHAQRAPLLVESAGGLQSPLTSTATNADLAALLELPVVLIAKNSLGTINHTCLTIEALRRRGLDVAAVVLVDTTPRDRSADSNARAIHQLTGIEPVGPLPFMTDLGAATDDTLADALAPYVAHAAWFARLTAAP